MSLTISVITPSFNQAEFLSRALASVASQTVKPIEHIVYDPGSKDGSRDIARNAPGVTLVTDPDKGQADAVARGMRESKGDIIAWLNSDDEYFDETVFADVLAAFEEEPQADIVFGGGIYVGQHDEYLRDAFVFKGAPQIAARLARGVGILQPATFISRKLIERIGEVDPALQFCMDYDFWIRAQKAGAVFKRLERNLAKARYYADNKTMGRRGESLLEVIHTVKKHFGFAHYNWLERLADFEMYGHDGVLEDHLRSGKDRESIVRRVADLNRCVNGDYYTVTKLLSAEMKREAGETRVLFEQGGAMHAGRYASPVELEAPAAPGVQHYTVGPQKWAFDKKWLRSELERSDALIEKLSAERRADTCVILGNGPSLKKVDFKQLDGADVFVTNYAVFSDEIRRIAKYLCVTNYLVAEQECARFNLLDEPVKFVPYWLSYCLIPTDATCYVRSVGKPEFSADYKTNISWRSTVSFFAMQLAYALGYRKVLLAGFDHFYIQPESKEGDLLDQREDDPNHFDPGYFKGKTWQAADTRNMEEMYKLARAAFEADGREILNCTVGGHLEVFDRSDIASELEKDRSAEKDRAQTLAHERDELIASLPPQVRAPAFLPTANLNIEAQVRGLANVVRLYKDELDQIYRPKLRAMKNSGRGRRCFIIGDGASLNRADLSKLRDEVTFAADGFLQKLDDLGWKPTYYLVEDRNFAEGRAAQINALKGTTKLVPAHLRYVIAPDESAIFFHHRSRKSAPLGFDFSFDAEAETFAGGGPVYTCLQLAVYLGYQEIYLVGVDAVYSTSVDASRNPKEPAKGVSDNSDLQGKGRRRRREKVQSTVAAYKEAKRACGEKGVRISNATIGGKLEVFPRKDFNSLFGEKPEPPRLLLIDHTRIGDGTATGEVKAALFSEWPEGKLLQLSSGGRNVINITGAGRRVAVDAASSAALEEIWRAITKFDPQVILYRPVPNTERLHAAAMNIIGASKRPYAIWIMDDWPTAFAAENAEAFLRLDRDWRWLVQHAEHRFSIGAAMSDAFSKRYGQPFEPFANGVDPADWPAPSTKSSETFRLRYAGSLANNMTLHSLRLVAKAVERLGRAGRKIVFEIKTRPLWHQRAAKVFEGLSHTKFIVADFTPEDYRKWLSDADAVVIAYNFDEESKAYVRYSVANKLPECMACGAPILAVGPADVATIAYLDEVDCGLRVLNPDPDEVIAAIKKLTGSSLHRLSLAEKAQQTAFEKHNIHTIRTALMNAIAATAQTGKGGGAFARDAHIRLDETEAVARLLANRRGADHVLVDVGAHVGSSAEYFHKLGWSAHCFEPDPANRKKLLQRFKSAPNVTIDPRAISDKPATGVSFFASGESTGISGLHAFRDTHRETAKVDVTTLADVIAERGLSRIDFLKIDAEGFDFFVLKGAPWDSLKPDVIECEFEDAKTAPLGYTWRDVADYLREKGYAVYVSEWHPIIRYGIAHDWRQVMAYPGADVAGDAWGNLLAFREDPGLEAVRKAFMDIIRRREQPAQQTAAKVEGRRKGAPGAVVEAPAAIPMAGRRKQMLIGLAKRTARHFWARRRWVGPLAIVAVGLFALGLAPALAPYRFLYWGALVAGAVSLIGLYLILRIQMIAQRALAESQRLHQTLAAERAKAREEERRRRPEMEALVATVDRRIGELAKNLAAVSARDMQSSIDMGDQLASLENQLEDVKRAALAAGERMAALNENALKESAKVAAGAKAIEALKNRAERVDTNLKNIRSLASAAPANNARIYQRFNRKIDDTHIAELETKWAPALSLELSRSIIGYMAHRACQVEARLHGRLATSIEDMLLRTCVAMGVKNENLHVLEIGTLFGAGAAVMYDALTPRFRTVRFSLLDPLDGYYAAGVNDKLTGEPVNEDMLRRNLSEVGMKPEELTLIKKLSTEPEAVEMASRERYDVLIIDGDHTYQGVKVDFDKYAPLVRPGGFIVFDDYSAPEWPDVKEFVDAEMPSAGFVEPVGHSWRTCIYRVTRDVSAQG